MNKDIVINLEKSFFTDKEKNLIENGSLEASIFTYKSGIHAVRLKNSYGYLVILPYKGQQIWDAVFNNRSMKMHTVRKEPVETDFFLNSYSCLMMHCGALRMGCPGEKDTHPLHGELPYADYSSAQIITGKDETGSYIGVTGIYEHIHTFAPSYYARPCVKFYENSGIFDISIEITNLLHYPMELMYMCHINFKSNQKSSIFQSVGWSEKDMVLSIEHLHEQDKLSDEKKNLLDAIKKNPKLTQTVTKDDVYDPEINYFFKNIKPDKNGEIHFLQVLDDGTGNYVGYKPDLLDHAVRWIWKNEDYDVMGMVLPSTCEPEGYLREKEKGSIKEIPGKGSVVLSVKCGYLNLKETGEMKKNLC